MAANIYPGAPPGLMNGCNIVTVIIYLYLVLLIAPEMRVMSTAASLGQSQPEIRVMSTAASLPQSQPEMYILTAAKVLA
ncbi:hypothetical protein RRG08_000783 [Elysia crispata]|uniref:Uncharacterized protein n=1 Tax=Elysia crispata TaxID=231223 RepID=A0AAE1D594_9GAST|nr:hypothetical protein RRG08_000783 [Elysia crispata]